MSLLMAKGKFIVIEGTDGSGKATQTKVLADKLTGAGYRVAMFDFPQYFKSSSDFVKAYLQGRYGSISALRLSSRRLFSQCWNAPRASRSRALLSCTHSVSRSLNSFKDSRTTRSEFDAARRHHHAHPADARGADSAHPQGSKYHLDERPESNAEPAGVTQGPCQSAFGSVPYCYSPGSTKKDKKL